MRLVRFAGATVVAALVVVFLPATASASPVGSLPADVAVFVGEAELMVEACMAGDDCEAEQAMFDHLTEDVWKSAARMAVACVVTGAVGCVLATAAWAYDVYEMEQARDDLEECQQNRVLPEAPPIP